MIFLDYALIIVTLILCPKVSASYPLYDCNGVKFTQDYVLETVKLAVRKFVPQAREHPLADNNAKYIYYPLLTSGELYFKGLKPEIYYVRIERAKRAFQVVMIKNLDHPPDCSVNANPPLCDFIESDSPEGWGSRIPGLRQLKKTFTGTS
ncbi:BgTH12-05218 [Blumeria graminis f. sp. triticale]|uniref:BgtE-5888 n=4 Tax=Blumeria graminis TaxID=34373 RepID=A0A9X9QCY1_BLUGR|nr:putative secreted effector protein [Blumeria graminis f. sp. tritici 96224]CAD6502627.1 BgTH12-05218 [Blumeria graminis f. sp. triticale]VDB88050.1 BgtE-5888 [Blumeria graminis f. sp. tritici]